MDRQTPPLEHIRLRTPRPPPTERLMRIAPLDLRQQRFKTVAARLRQDRGRGVPDRGRRRLRARAARDRSAAAGPEPAGIAARRAPRAGSQPAQHAADRAAAGRRDQGRGAERGQADRARRPRAAPTSCCRRRQVRLEEVERDINEMRLRRRGVEGSLEASIQALYHALEFIREQDRPDDRRPAPSPAPGRRAVARSRGWMRRASRDERG